MLNSIVYSTHARHVSTWLIVPAYDEYTALVKSGNVANKHVWKAVIGAYCWWKTWISLLKELCDVSSGYVVVCPLLFFPSARVNWCICASVVIFSNSVVINSLSVFSVPSLVISVCAVHVA